MDFMNRIFTTATAISFAILTNFTAIHSRPFRPEQIPNGTVNSCANCHVSPQGGGQLTPFGRTVSDDYLDINGDVIWNASLASKDSDGDGFSNGFELQDPDGEWTIGQPGPGDPKEVFNPGDAASKPSVDFVEMLNIASSVSIAPNPFSDNTTIAYSLKQSGIVSIFIVSLNGEIIKNIFGNYIPAGKYRFIWDGKDGNGNDSPSGQYLMLFQFNGEAIVRKIYYMK